MRIFKKKPKPKYTAVERRIVGEAVLDLEKIERFLGAPNTEDVAGFVMKPVSDVRAVVREEPEFSRFMEKTERKRPEVAGMIKTAYQTLTGEEFTHDGLYKLLTNYPGTTLPQEIKSDERLRTIQEVLKASTMTATLTLAGLSGIVAIDEAQKILKDPDFILNSLNQSFIDTAEPLESRKKLECKNSVGDSDKDCISDIDELKLGTDPKNKDTDKDGLPDGWEYMWSLDPKQQNLLVEIDYHGGNHSSPAKFSDKAKKYLTKLFGDKGIKLFIDDSSSVEKKTINGGGQILVPGNTIRCEFPQENIIDEWLDRKGRCVGLSGTKIVDEHGITTMSGFYVSGKKVGSVIEENPISFKTVDSAVFDSKFFDVDTRKGSWHYGVVADDIYGNSTDGWGHWGGLGRTPGYQFTIKNNDTMRSQNPYNWIWEARVFIHEIGHNFGLPHDKDINSPMHNITKEEAEGMIVLTRPLGIDYTPQQWDYIKNEGLAKSLTVNSDVYVNGKKWD